MAFLKEMLIGVLYFGVFALLLAAANLAINVSNGNLRLTLGTILAHIFASLIAAIAFVLAFFVLSFAIAKIQE